MWRGDYGRGSKGAGKGRGLIDGETTRRLDDIFMIRKRGERKRYADRLFVGQSLRSIIQRSGLGIYYGGAYILLLCNIYATVYLHRPPFSGNVSAPLTSYPLVFSLSCFLTLFLSKKK